MADSKTPNPNKVLGWLQVIVTVVAIFVMVGGLFVWKERQEQQGMSIKTLTESVAGLKNDVTTGMHNMDMRMAGLEQKARDRETFYEDMKRHVSDKSLHLTEDQVKIMVAVQLQPLTNAMAEVRAQMPVQQKQLDKIEQIMGDLLRLKQAEAIRGKSADKNPNG